MQWINNYFSIFIIPLLFVACEDDTVQLISNNTDYPDQSYKLNLQSNSGYNLDSVTISWNETNGEVILMDSSTHIPTEGNSHSFSLEPGAFKDISIEVIMEVDLIYKDIIQIFTRPVYPVTGFEFEIDEVMRGNGVYDDNEEFTDLDDNNEWNDNEEFIDIKYPQYHRRLKWDISNESSNNFTNYTLYRVNSENIDDLVNTECNYCKIDVLTKLSDSTYIDSSSDIINKSGIAAFYYMVQVSAGDFTKNSFIYNYTDFNQLEQIQLAEGNISTDKNDYINITWQPISDLNFYQYEIYRSPNEELTNITIMALITNSSIEYFQDRKAGNGTTWYYSVAVRDISGRRNFSKYIPGWSIP